MISLDFDPESWLETIVLVDDDVTYSLLVTRAFRKEGLEPLLKVLAGGPQLRDFLDEACPRVVLLDMNLEGASGLDLLRWVRTRSRHPWLPVILHSHTVDRADQEAAFASGANAFVPKPSSLKELRALARELTSFWVLRNVLL